MTNSDGPNSVGDASSNGSTGGGVSVTSTIALDTHDLANLTDLNEEIILDYLRVRYKNDVIYTYLGDILLAINPFKPLQIYDNQHHQIYTNSVIKSNKKHHHNHHCARSQSMRQMPHVYALAQYAYETLKSTPNNNNPAASSILSYDLKSQCCVISGESGAGKTESAKHFIQHLIYLCGLGNTRLELQILQVNPLLEAFGNATTLMNDNSSRFGKYIELSFVNSKLVGAKITEYLLEKSRVVFQNEGEFNFHIFYYLLAGLVESGRRECYFLGAEDQSTCELVNSEDMDFSKRRNASFSNPSSSIKEVRRFGYLKNYSLLNLDSSSRIRLVEKYEELVNALNYVAFMESEQTELFSILIGILHVGNLRFKANEEGYAKFVYSADSKHTLLAISSLLGINASALVESLTTSVPVAGARDEFVRNYTLDGALDARDALAKHVYFKLFAWLVSKINKTLSYNNNNDSSRQHDNVYNSYKDVIKEIGILDIYGFEHFEKNSFEQLCINLANEQIQYFFNKHIFILEKEEYSREAIQSYTITFNDNQPLLDLFMSNFGILKKLDDLCKLPKATDYTLIENFNSEFSKNYYYQASKRNDLNFSIKHYAGRVTYNAENFLEKNRDSLPYRVAELLRHSSNEILSEIFSLSHQPGVGANPPSFFSTYTMNTMRGTVDKGSSRLSVSAQYKNSLEILMKRMSNAKPIFLRCIKPNSSKRPNDFNEKFVLLQLRYCGILETIRIRREGYSIRPTFQEFVDKYRYLSPDSMTKPDRFTCSRILEYSNLKNWQIGKTKIFLKYYHYDQLKLLLERYIYYATVIQKFYRRRLAVKELKKRSERANKERNKVAEFCGHLSLKSANLFQTIQNTSFIKMSVTNTATLNRTTLNSHVHRASIRHVDPKYGTTDEYQRMQRLKPTSRIDIENQQERCESAAGVVMPKLYDNTNKKKERTSPASSVSPNRSIGGNIRKRPGSRNELTKRVETLRKNSRDPSWLYGKITRGQAEEYLKSKEIGTFLIRKSDSRDGYSLSFRAETRCRHYMIDALPNGKFIIIGEPKTHNSLKDLVEYHRKHKLSNWNGYLSFPYVIDD